ncbi:MAG TPA: L,D-transpeptidase [Anaerolineales bacterium]
MSDLGYSCGNNISRRDFLKLSGVGLLGLITPPLDSFEDFLPDQQGRVLDLKIALHAKPSFNSQEIKVFWKDTVLPVSKVTVGDEEPAHNRIWYRIGDEGYAHSGSIQPVKTTLNPPADHIPTQGTLAEVTVPFTDAHWGPGKDYPVAYRFYYETTHWITARVSDLHGDPWYRISDDKWDFVYYVPATHLRIVSQDELTPISPHVPPAEKRLEVRLSQQLVIAHEGDQQVFMARAATGTEFSNGRYLTPSGVHTTFHKRPSRHMAAGNLAANGYDLPGVPWISYITESGIAFHGTYWHNDYGRPRSHGCINLTSQASKWIYRWTLPVVPPDQQRVYEDYGTQVLVI